MEVQMIRLLVLMVVGSLFTAPGPQAASVSNPLDARVTIDYRDTPAADVLGALAAAAGVPLKISAGALRPVTITLTNVKLGTALSAVCENASCVWHVTSGLYVTPIPSASSASLPLQVSVDVYDTPARDVFRAVAAAVGVAAVVDPRLSSEPITMHFKSATTAQVLNMLCERHGCEWDFDPASGLRVMRKP
jgi:hypothetical protein